MQQRYYPMAMCAYLDRDVNLNSLPAICRPRSFEQSDWSVRTRADSRPGNETSVFAYLVGIWHELWTYGLQSSRCERLVLEERPRRTCCCRSRTHRLRGTTVPVQDETGMEICNDNCACVNRWILPVYTYNVFYYTTWQINSCTTDSC